MSYWPRPQQQLPVSATGGGHCCCPDAKAEKGGCFMTFEQVVLLLSLLGGAIYVTFQITWTISNGKKK